MMMMMTILSKQKPATTLPIIQQKQKQKNKIAVVMASKPTKRDIIRQPFHKRKKYYQW